MGLYEESLARLNTAQRQAVEQTDGPVLVIAGPGTGKTSLLTTRVAHIIATTDTLPENILCLTFTDAAAHVMRERLTAMIGQAAYNVTISTYHAFGSDLIQRYPDYFAEARGQRPADDLTVDSILRKIISDLPYLSPLTQGESYLGDIRSTISDCKRALLTPDDLKDISIKNREFIELASPIVTETLGKMARISAASQDAFASVLSAMEQLAVQAPSPQLGLKKMACEQLRAALAEAEDSKSTKPLTAWKNTWLAKNTDGEFILDGSKTCAKLEALAEVYQQYLAALTARGLFDFDDMILRAVRTLEQNEDFRYTLQERYQYLLLDEFQDTNEAQLRLVELLTDSPVFEGRPNVLAVGDDDQAIYAFQGANYSHMLRFYTAYRDVLVVPLTENYRSHQEILDVASAVSTQITERLHHHFDKIDKTIVAAVDHGPRATIHRIETASDAEQFTAVAEQIQQLIQRGVPAKEIAVLAPKHKHLEPLVAYLHDKSIPVQYDKRENILDNPAITQLITLTRLVLAIQSQHMATANMLWPEVLSYRFWGLTTDQIWQLSWQANDTRSDWTTLLMGSEDTRAIALFFVRLSQCIHDETLESVLDYLIGTSELDTNDPIIPRFTSPFYTYYFDNGDLDVIAQYYDVLSDLTVLRARLRDYRIADEGPLHAQDFIDFVDAHHAADIKILNTSPHQESDDAVQIMTAYKSKGQEFTAVFLLAVNDEVWGSRARMQSSHIGLPPNLQHIRYAGATEDERLRLFYVALTRARTDLYIVNYRQAFTGKQFSRLKYLNESSDDNTTLTSPLLPHHAILSDHTAAVVEPTGMLQNYWLDRHVGQALSEETLRTLLMRRLDRFQLSPTHVNSFIDLQYAGPSAFFVNTILRFPKAPHASGQYGNAIHETIEWLHRDVAKLGTIASIDTAQDFFSEKLREKRLNTRDFTFYDLKGRDAVAAYIAQRAHTMQASDKVELNFKHEGVFYNDVHLSGKIDKLVIDAQNKTIDIIDFKTGKSHAKWSSDIKLHKYAQQLYLYRYFIEKSRTYQNFTVRSMALEFVEPDEEGKIKTLELPFDQAAYEHTLKLTDAVWKHVRTLSFPDTSAYPISLTGVKQFELDLIAGTI